MGLLKMVRILRLGRIIAYLNMKDNIKMSLKLGKLIFLLMIYLHCFGCCWYILVKGNEEWMPPLDYVWVKTDIYDMSTDYKYWMSLYHSVLILAGNDIGPRGELQLIVCMLFVTIGAIINGNIFGELAVLMAAMNRKQTRFSEQIDTTNTAMANLRLPGYIQKSIQ
jgi:hypothetical protein